MTTTKKLVIAVVALSLALVCVVGGTLAWLIAESAEVVNTFTVGKIEIDLNETDVDNDSDTKKNSYEVMPGGTVVKDPYVTVKANSENCYVYVMVTNNLVIDGNAVASYVPNTDWELVGTKTVDGVTTNLYRYVNKVETNAADQDLPTVFDEVVYADEAITLENIQNLQNKTIVVKAYAHQADNVELDDVTAAAIEWAKVEALANA